MTTAAVTPAIAHRPPRDAVSPRLVQRLIEIRKWTRLLIISCSLLGVEVMAKSMIDAVKTGDYRGNAFSFVQAACYLVAANLLAGYARSLSRLFDERSTTAFDAAFGQLRRLWTGVAATMIASTLAAVILFVIPSIVARSNQKDMLATMSDMRKISDALEKYAAEHHAYPAAKSFAAVVRQLEPKYGTALPRSDYWKNDFRYSAQCDKESTTCWSYRLASCGSDHVCASDDLFTYGEEPAGSNAKTDLLYGNGRPLTPVGEPRL
ncbi:MAG TPA: hypothetical protein VLV78_23555 [Thermoanaerobaculia bacterium]|nr:hypothetical protein [Thermoanaerobaculia bacterium]